ncbi:MAG TPA: hypothetical protein VKU38_09060 [Ktedonobacteraceae bacterium]|nr:hypothetical protein [Ktedonobacteraceae bacterium]
MNRQVFSARTTWIKANLPPTAPAARATLAVLILLGLLVSACAGIGTQSNSNTQSTGTNTTSGGSSTSVSFPTTPAQLRTPAFGTGEQIAPSVKVLASVAPTLIVQFPLVPSGIKSLFPNATALVTVVEGNPQISIFDTVTVDVQHMPPFQKFTVFFVESSIKPFGHAEYVGDVITRGDGSGESIFHLITFVAFAADARNSSVTSADQTGTASGVQLEHVGMWFDGLKAARQVLQNNTIPGTPFDGGNPALHAGPQAMTDGQTLPVI